MNEMKTSVVVSLSLLIAFTLALVGFLLYTGKDITGLMVSLPAIVGVIGALFGINSINRKTEAIQKQTNGTHTALQAAISAKEAENSALRSLLTPEQAASVPITVSAPTTAPAAAPLLPGTPHA